MQTLLIVGGDAEKRREKANQFVDSCSISQFDVTDLSGEGGIADIRKLIHTIWLKPTVSREKAIIIQEAQTLTKEAQNALLKTLEEPPEHSIIILTVPNEGLLLPTIVSRCKLIELTTNNQQLTASELEVSSQQLEVLLKGGVGERLKFAQDNSKTREDAITYVSNLIVSARNCMLETLDPPYTTLLEALQKAHFTLKTTNASPRLTLEALLINIKH